MLIQLLRFEIFYQRKQRALPLLALLFLFFGYMLGAQRFAPAHVNFNAGYEINRYVGLFSLGSVFIVMFFVVSGVLRDSAYRLDNIIFSTAIKKYQFFWSRFLGIFIFSVMAFSPLLVGFFSGVMLAPHDPERIAPFDLLVYVQPWLVIAVPNILICSTIIFAAALLTRNTIATYASATAIYALYFVCSIFLNSPLMAQSVPASPQGMAIAAMADPFAISAFFEQTQYWTPFEKNTQLLSFSGYFLWNRVLWIFLSIVFLGITYRMFSFRKTNEPRKKISKALELVQTSTPISPVLPLEGWKAHISSLWSLLKIERRMVFNSLPFLAVVATWVVIVFSELYTRIFQGGQYGDSWYPFTNLLLDLFRSPLKFMALILIVFYSGELVWRERSLNYDGIINTSPTRNWVLFISKLLTLISLPVILIVVASLIAIGLQFSQGHFNVEWPQYLMLFYYEGWQLLIFCMMAIFVQSVVLNKYAGMAVTILLIMANLLPRYIGIEHPLLSLGLLPQVDYTNMSGYGQDARAFYHLSLYWLAFGCILSVVSFKLWRRGSSTIFILRVKRLISNWSRGEVVLLGMFCALLVSSGVLIFYNTHIVTEYRTDTDNLDYREAYERKFKQYETLAQLFPTSIRAEVDLYPNDHSYAVRCHSRLKNKGAHEVSMLLLTETETLSEVNLEKAILLEHDSILGTYLWKFIDPVQPGQELEFSYAFRKELKGYETDNGIVRNGTYLVHRGFSPALAYRSSVEINDNFERACRGLPPVEKEDIDDHLQLEDSKIGRISFEAIVSTDESEIALTSGTLVKAWSENHRNYYNYKASGMIIPTVAYMSAKYAIRKDIVDGISLEQYYDPRHAFNIEAINDNTRATLEYCRTNFGEYPFKYLRIAEVPAHWPFGGFAHPGLISMVEDNLYLIDIRNPHDFNLVAKRTIHEVAHQWWGHVLTPGAVPGGSLFVEGFAKYTEAVVMEKMYGPRAVFRLSENANRRYFTGRAYATEPEPPLSLVNGQGYLSYGKNYTVMLALRDLIGEEKLNRVLRKLVDEYGNRDEFTLQSSAFLAELYRVTPDQDHSLIDDWFKRIVTYDMSIAGATYRKLSNGQFEVNIAIDASRKQIVESGQELPITINESISVGIFRQHPGEISSDHDIIYLQPHRITGNDTIVRIVVSELPAYVAVDPFGTRNDENLINNISKLTEE